MTDAITTDDPARAELVKRAKALGITGNPDKAAHALGEVTLADGRVLRAHVLHAIDAVISDGKSVVVIDRKGEPGKGRPALPGGFLDPLPGGGVEHGQEAAMREAMEEAGVKLGQGKLVGTRHLDRAFDVRIAYSDMPQYGIEKGDAFLVSTQAVHFAVGDLSIMRFTAGDDAKAGSARPVRLRNVREDFFGVPDHFALIREAVPAPEAETAASWVG